MLIEFLEIGLPDWGLIGIQSLNPKASNFWSLLLGRSWQYDSTEPTDLFVFPLMGEDIVCNAADSTTGSVEAIFWTLWLYSLLTQDTIPDRTAVPEYQRKNQWQR